MRLVTLGELLIDMFPSQVGLHLGEVEAFLPKPGGAPANVAVAASRLGARSAFIGKVGEDYFGLHLQTVLREAGVDMRGLRFDQDARTTMAIIAMPDEDQAEFVFYRNPGADQRLSPQDLDQQLLGECDAFHFGSLSLTHEPARSATLEALSLARQAGALISFDVNYRPSLWPDAATARGQAASALDRVDLVKVNEGELSLLTSTEPASIANLEGLDRSAAALLQSGPKAVVVTLGRQGSYFRTAEASGHVTGFEVESIDSIGCGDAFVAGLLTRLVQDRHWAEGLTEKAMADALRYANAVGALTSLKRGVIPALPTAQEVDAFLAQSEGGTRSAKPA